MPQVARTSRLFDIAALCCILCGSALGLSAFNRFSALSKLSYRHPGPSNQSALAAADRARYTAYSGVALIITGFGFGVYGALLHTRTRHRVDITG